jgi:hypothetical protein
MFNELPGICLDCGGPAVSVRENSGIKVPLGSRAQVISGLAAAIKRYDQNRGELQAHGKRARQIVLAEYDWDRKGEQMNAIYAMAIARAADSPAHGREARFTGIGGAVQFLHSVVSLKGMTTGMLALLLVGALCFMSLSNLRSQADAIVTDTLPGLAYAGAANSHLADAYRTLAFIVTDDLTRRSELKEQMDTIAQRTDNYLQQYRSSIFTDEDRANFELLEHERAAYTKIRDRVLALAAAGRRDEALNVFYKEVIPEQALAKKAGDRLLEYNMNEARSRGEHIMSACTRTQVLMVAVGLGVFVLGYFLGLFK